jgi:hypothetical protein
MTLGLALNGFDSHLICHALATSLTRSRKATQFFGTPMKVLKNSFYLQEKMQGGLVAHARRSTLYCWPADIGEVRIQRFGNTKAKVRKENADKLTRSDPNGQSKD